MSEENKKTPFSNATADALFGAVSDFKESFDSLPGKVSYAINKTLANLSTSLTLIGKTRVELLESHADKDEEGKFIYTKLSKKEKEAGTKPSYTFSEGVMEIVSKEYQDIMDSDSDVVIHKIPLSAYSVLDIPKLDNIIMFDHWMIDEDK
jgi:hypothetical protein